MKYALFIFGMATAFFGGVLTLNVMEKLNAANAGFVEIQALLLFLIAAVLIVGAGIIAAIEKGQWRPQ